MNIFKNLSNQEKKKLIKELESMPYRNKIGFNEKVATNIHWLIWKNNDYHLTDEERAKMNFPKIESIVEQRQKEIETEMTREKVEKVLTINKVLNNEKSPAVKISDYYYNANYVKLGFALMDKTKKVKFMLNEKATPALTMTDGEISIMIMPLSLDVKNEFDREKVIDPDSITAEDVEKARKYKLYLDGKAKYEKTEYYYDTKNMIVKKGNYFVTFSRDNEFFNRVFNFNPDDDANFDGAAGDFECDPEQHKDTEDLFHKKITYFKNITHGNFWHFYENGTGVCFTA